MSILADVPEIRNSVMKMSVEFYHASTEMGWIEENVELLRGIPVEKMSKSPEHEHFVRIFLRLIEKVAPSGFFVAKESPITTRDSEPEPDLMLVEGDELKDFRKSHPTTAKLVLEVSISTEKRDLTKADIYAEAGVEEYWIILPEKKEIIIHRNSDGSKFESVTTTAAGMVVSESVEGLTVEVPSIFD